MHVCIDIQSAVTQRAGVGRYTRMLAQHLGTATQSDTIHLFYFDFKRKGAPLDIPGVRHKASHWCPGRIAQLAWKTIHFPPFDFFAGAADLYHFPNFVLPPLRKGKSVVTIHDMGFARYPEFTEKGNLRHLNACLTETVQRADAIIAVSQFSADEVCELMNVPGERVHAVHNGMDPELCAPPPDQIQAVRNELDLDRPYLLAVGTIEPRKNFPFLIDIFEQLTDFDGDLVIAGMAGWKCEPIMKRFKESSRASSIRWLSYVGDSHLPALYAGAEALLFPSFYEGFGFPPLEAMACDTPVISAANSSLTEVLGDAAVMLDSFDTEQWCDSVRSVLSDSELRETLVRMGHEQVAKFSWAKTARQTWDVYRQVAN